jgi:hypothetical protein
VSRDIFVSCQPQPEQEIWRAIVFSRDGTEVLLKISERGLLFPAVEVPRWERLAENLTAALKKDWGCDAVCLFTPDNSSQDGNADGHHYEVMECWHDEHIGGTDWKSLHSLAEDSFQEESDFRTLTRCLHELDAYEHDPSSPFARRGLIPRVQAWATDAIQPLGLELGSSFRQFNASASFSLIRFETDGPAIWFKAVGKPNLREFPITLKLAELFPGFIPKILAFKPEWNGWLSREVDGKNLGETGAVALWERAATDLARLQIESIVEAESIRRLGAHDLRVDVLLSAIDPFFELAGRLMDEQAKTPPAILTREELSLLRVQVDDALTLLRDLGIPDTLGHMDLNPRNIIAAGDGCVFLDWAEAYVGCPFFSLEYLLEHLRRDLDASPDRGARVIDAYKTDTFGSRVRLCRGRGHLERREQAR